MLSTAHDNVKEKEEKKRQKKNLKKKLIMVKDKIKIITLRVLLFTLG